MIVRPSKRKVSLWNLILGTLIATSLSAGEEKSKTMPQAPEEKGSPLESTKSKSRLASARDFVKKKATDVKQKAKEGAGNLRSAFCTSPKIFIAKNDTVLFKVLGECIKQSPEEMNKFLDDLKKKQADKEGGRRNAQEALGVAFSEHLGIYNESVDNKKDKEKKKNVKLSNSRQKELKQKIETFGKEISALRRQISKIEDAKTKVVNDIVGELDVKGGSLEGKEDENLKPEMKSEIERLVKLVSRINGTSLSFEEEGKPISQEDAAGEESVKTEGVKTETSTSSSSLEGDPESKGKGSLLTAPLPPPLRQKLLPPGNKPPVPPLPPLAE